MFAAIVGLALIFVVLADCFEVMVLPRRITRRWRLTRMYYRTIWRLWRIGCRVIPAGRYRQNALGIFGPLSVLILFAVWATSLITGFALVQWGLQTLPGAASRDFRQCLYHSGETFFTLGYGDVTPKTYTGKFLAVVEAGTGFGFMAIVIGYLPVLYQAFSKREQSIALLDARAGSPPTAGELLRRAGRPADCSEIERFLAEWEMWSAELLESNLSFPILGFYRSQHDNQSWLMALATVLDASSVLLVTGSTACRRRAELTFAMARHACVDLCLIYWLPPIDPPVERLTAAECEKLPALETETVGLSVAQVEQLRQLRELYEPFLQALASYFSLQLQRFFPEEARADNWQTSAWTKRAPGITELPGGMTAGKHFG